MNRLAGIALGLALLCIPLGASAQKEAAIWYFGNNAGLDFRSGTPVPLLDGQLNTIEGCESFSDPEGNLLFYTDGKTVWNRRHEPMPNGTDLRSSFSTSQAALVVPQPGVDYLYYVFTPDDALAYRGLTGETSNGFNYSLIDMRQASGMGDVVLKNRDLLAQAAENVSAVRNFESDFYWVLTHYRDRFYAYRVDAGGLDTRPVVSRIGPGITESENYRGNIKVSPDGSKVAITHNILEPDFEGRMLVYDFDSATGAVSNPVALPQTHLYYGAEFSPDSSKLYASALELLPGEGEDKQTALGNLQIVQFDLDAADLAASRYIAHDFERSLPGWISGALQLAIDGKIYHSIPGDALSVIRSPDKPGINCDFRPYAISLGGRDATYGLPPYIQSFFETIVEIEQYCAGEPTRFRIDSSGGIESVRWDFGDPASGAANRSALQDPEHLFSDYGVFEVRLEVTYDNGSVRDFIEFVEIAERPELAAEVTLVQCDIDGVDDGRADFNLREAIALISPDNPDINAYFFATRADAEANVNHLEPEGYRNGIPGEVIYARAFENPECAAVITIRLETQWQADYGRVLDVPVCLVRPPSLAVEFDPVSVVGYLEAEFPDADFIGVYPGETEALMDTGALEPGPYFLGPFDSNRFWFRVEEEGGCDVLGIVDLDFQAPPQAELEMEVALCNGVAQLEAAGGFDGYVWDDGRTDRIRTVSEPGTYAVELFGATCSWTQTFTVVPPGNFTLVEVVVEDFRENNRVRVLASESQTPLRYSLDGGQSYQDTGYFDDLLPGVYDLQVTDGCQVSAKELVVGGLPAFFSPNGDGYNDRWELENASYFGAYEIRIFDRFGTLVGILSEAVPGWDGNRSGSPLPESDYWYLLRIGEEREITGHFSLIR